MSLLAGVHNAVHATASRQQTALSELAEAGARGVTVGELRTKYPEHGNNDHHGSWSGTLAKLHKDGSIARLAERRNGRRIYVHPAFVFGRETETQGYGPSALEVLIAYWMEVDPRDSTTGRTTRSRAEKYPQRFATEMKQAWKEHSER